MKALKLSGLSAVEIVTSFLRRRIQPLQQRVKLGFEYTDIVDPSQMTQDELSDVDLLDCLWCILLQESDLPLLEVKFGASNPPPSVSIVIA